MFSSKDKGMRKETPLEKSEIKAFLGPGSQFEGRLAFDQIVRIDGNFRGEISSRDTLIIGATADIEADIQVGTLIISGKFKGNVKVASMVELRSPAVVEGTIDTPALSVEKGVVLNSTLVMNRKEEPAAPAKK